MTDAYQNYIASRRANQADWDRRVEASRVANAFDPTIQRARNDATHFAICFYEVDGIRYIWSCIHGRYEVSGSHEVATVGPPNSIPKPKETMKEFLFGNPYSNVAGSALGGIGAIFVVGVLSLIPLSFVISLGAALWLAGGVSAVFFYALAWVGIIWLIIHVIRRKRRSNNVSSLASQAAESRSHTTRNL